MFVIVWQGYKKIYTLLSVEFLVDSYIRFWIVSLLYYGATD